MTKMQGTSNGDFTHIFEHTYFENYICFENKICKGAESWLNWGTFARSIFPHVPQPELNRLDNCIDIIKLFNKSVDFKEILKYPF